MITCMIYLDCLMWIVLMRKVLQFTKHNGRDNMVSTHHPHLVIGHVSKLKP